MQKDTAQSVPAQGATSQNSAYDAFVDKLDFSSGKYETHVAGAAGGDTWRAKLFAKDVIEKYGPGKYTVKVTGPNPTTGAHNILCAFVVEG